MKKLIIALLFTNSLFAQLQPLTTPNNGGNKRATISENIHLCEVKLTYNRPAVKGREGKIWGTEIAHYGLKDLQFGSSKAAPWRVGANECTVITFSTEAKVEGKNIAPGTYGLLMNLGETETTIIFNKNTSAWGSYSYNPTEDVLQVTVNNEAISQRVEFMKFEFDNQSPTSAILALLWEKRRIPMKIEVDGLKLQFLSFNKELETPKGFTSAAFLQAANFCLQNNYEMEQGLAWATRAASNLFPGEKNFSTLSTLANFLTKTGKQAEADILMKEAMPLGTPVQVNAYARSLISQKREKEAMEIYKSNYDKNPNSFAGNFGMIRAHSALGEFKKALEFARKALPLSPNEAQKAIVEKIIIDLGAGKNIN